MNTQATPILSMTDLRKSFGPKEVLGGLDLEIHQGEILCLVGPSGSGKTTLLRCLSGLHPVTSGELSFQGEPITKPPVGLAVVFQDYSRSLLPWKRVGANVALPLVSAGWKKSDRQARVAEMLDAVNLPGVANLYPRQLSGGMQQRVAIARALAVNPTLLLMDEPFAALDAQTREDLQDMVLQIREKFGVTVVFVTHDVSESVYLADRVAVLTKVPATIAEVVRVPLPTPRDQFTTKSHPEFAHLRNHVLAKVRGVEDPTEAANEPA